MFKPFFIRMLYFGSRDSFYGFPHLVALNLKRPINLPVAFALQNNSEFRDIFNYHIIKMREAGILARSR